MPIPKPNEGESSFMSRCIRVLIDEGTPKEQAIAICTSEYRKEKVKVLTWKTIDRQRSGFIKYAQNQTHKALKAQARESIQKVEQSGLSTEYQISSAVLEDALFKICSRVIPSFAKETFNKMTKDSKKTEINWQSYVARWFDENTLNLVDGITETTRKGIRVIAEKTISEGLSIADFKKEVMQSYSISSRRAELIGRTEVIKASNAGSLIGAEETGIPMRKFWLATRDSRTRGQKTNDIFDHFSMDENKGIDLKESFNVSGEFLDYPGDPKGSPGNIINCRCTLTYEVIE